MAQRPGVGDGRREDGTMDGVGIEKREGGDAMVRLKREREREILER
jgi:hypothetical protein